MKKGVNKMRMEIRFTQQELNALRNNLQDILEVSAVRAYETAVERAPASGQGRYSTGQMRQAIRLDKTGEMEWTILSPMPYSIFVEFGTGPRGRATGRRDVEEFENDPYYSIDYHGGEVEVTRWRGQLLKEPFIRRTEGMEARSFLRKGLLVGYEELKRLLSNNR